MSQSTYYLEYGRHLARLRRRRRRAYAPTSNTASHDNHEKINSWVSFSFLYEYEAPLGGPSGRRSSAKKDKVSNFWLKHLVSLHEDLAKAYTKVIEQPEETPEWLTEGITYLLPKTEETKNPKNYRPITSLPTMYKILTSIIAERTDTFLNEHQLLPSEQKGCKRGSYGCKDQLLINKIILEDCKTKKKNLSTAWIDYKKAFDSVPHTWIIKCVEIYKICPVTVNFIAESMKCWKTT